MKTIIVLGGAGAMGQITAQDLADTAKGDKIIIADYNIENLSPRVAELKKRDNVELQKVDIRQESELVELLKQGQCVVNSTPYYFNLDVMNAALKANCHYLDLGGLYHMSLKQLTLHEQFKKENLLAVAGTGAAPGTTNLLAAQAIEELDKVETIDIACGSKEFVSIDHPFLPPYMLDTLFDEYTKDAMVFENGKAEGRNPLAMQKSIDFGDPVGTQPAIFTLHSEVATLPLSYKDKGVKNVYFRLALPQELHEKLKLFVGLGFGSVDPVETTEGKFHPRKLLAHMISKIEFERPKFDDCEILRVDVKGSKGGRDVMITMTETCWTDKTRNIAAGDLNTGVPPSIVAQMIVHDKVKHAGVLAAEQCIDPKAFFAELEKRNIKITKAVNEAVH